MDKFVLEASNETPSVVFDPLNNNFEISGVCLPENAKAFFELLNVWIKSFSEINNSKTVFNIKMIYFNTASSKCLLDFFDLLENQLQSPSIKWFYNEDDRDMESAGEEYAELVNIPFELVEQEFDDDEDYY